MAMSLARPPQPSGLAQNGSQPPQRLRNEILALLAETDRPRKAYELMRHLQRRLGRHLSPPTLYRALDRLVGEGLVARIESRAAYVAVDGPETAAQRVFLLCGDCGEAHEIHSAALAELEQAAALLGFRVAHGVIELEGTCRNCEGHDTDPSGA